MRIVPDSTAEDGPCQLLLDSSSLIDISRRELITHNRLELSSEIYKTLMALIGCSFRRKTTDTTNGMTTDVYPRENCLAPDYSMTILTQEREMRGIAHRRDTGEMGVGRDGRVIDLHLLTGREGGRRRGRERCRCWGGTAR